MGQGGGVGLTVTCGSAGSGRAVLQVRARTHTHTHTHTCDDMHVYALVRELPCHATLPASGTLAMLMCVAMTSERMH